MILEPSGGGSRALLLAILSKLAQETEYQLGQIPEVIHWQFAPMNNPVSPIRENIDFSLSNGY